MAMGDGILFISQMLFKEQIVLLIKKRENIHSSL